MSSLTYSEQILLGSILAAVIAGMAMKHWRDARREKPVPMASLHTVSSPSANDRRAPSNARRY